MVKMNSAVATQRMGNVPDEKRFWCRDGRYVRNLAELMAALEDMSEDTFHYHSNAEKSDFSNWVRDVIGDDKLARDLQKSTSPEQAARRVADRLAWLREKA